MAATLSPPASASPQFVGDRCEQDLFAIVTVFPVHDSAQAVLPDEAGFLDERLLVFVGHETSQLAVPEIRGASGVVPPARKTSGRHVVTPELVRGDVAREEIEWLAEAGGALPIHHPLPLSRVKRHTDDDLLRGHAGLEILPHERFSGVAAPLRAQGRVMAGGAAPAAVHVVGHDVEPVQERVQPLDLRGLEVTVGARGDGECLAANEIELVAQKCDELREVLFVLRPKTIPRTTLTGKLPVDVQPVELVSLDQGHGTGDESAS